MNRKNLFVFIGLLALVLVVIVISAFHKKAPKDEISIGLIVPLTGFAQSYGEKAVAGAKRALENTSGVVLKIEDEKCDPVPALLGFQKLVSVDQVDILVGPLCGSPQEAIALELAKSKLPVILPSAAPLGLFDSSSGSMFNIQYSLESEGAAIADHMYRSGHTQAVVVRYKNAFSESEMDGFEKAYRGTIVKELVFQDNLADIASELATLKEIKFDSVFVSDMLAFTYKQGVQVLKRYGMNQQVYTNYPAEDPSLRALEEGVIYSFPGDISGTEGATYWLTYDAVKKAVDVAKACRSDKSCMIQKLQQDSDFDESGTSTRPIIFKQIVDGEPVVLSN